MKVFLSILFWIVMSVMTLLVFLAALAIRIFLFPFDRKRKIAHAQGFWWGAAIIGSNPFWGFSMSGIEHIDPKKTYIIVANHQSLADIIMLYKTRIQFKWVAKESLFKIPIFGWCMSLMGYIKLTRGKFGSIKDSYFEASKWLRRGVSVLFFPEGTRSLDGKINDFKNGAFKLALQEQKSILPIRLEGSYDVLPKGSLIFKKRVSCRLTILPEIDTSSFPPEDFALLREKTREAISAAA